MRRFLCLRLLLLYVPRSCGGGGGGGDNQPVNKSNRLFASGPSKILVGSVNNDNRAHPARRAEFFTRRRSHSFCFFEILCIGDVCYRRGGGDLSTRKTKHRKKKEGKQIIMLASYLATIIVLFVLGRLGATSCRLRKS